MSVRLNIFNFLLKWTLRPVLNRVNTNNPARLRPWLNKSLEWGLRPARGVKIKATRMSALDVSVLQIENGNSDNGTMLYLHGGAYIFGSATTHRRFVAHICGLCGLKGISLNYRLAPEYPFPAGLEDAVAVYKEILASGVQNIILAGDSAGGGLTLCLLARVLSENLPKPVGIVVFSPWTDMTISSKSMITNDKTEYMLPPHQIRNARDYYAPDDFKNPLASPLFANFTGAPPVLIFASKSEVLLDDAVGVANNMKASNVDVALNLYENTPHVWILGHGRLPEADRAMAETQEFINRVLQT